jgi:hypothetical protein
METSLAADAPAGVISAAVAAAAAARSLFE